jgi:hypothetical protein
MHGTEEIRFKAGDACCSILGRDMTWALSGHVRVIGSQPLQGRTQQQFGTGRAMVPVFSWRWSCCHESEPSIARSLTGASMHHT